MLDHAVQLLPTPQALAFALTFNVQAWVLQALSYMPTNKQICTRNSRSVCMRSSKLPYVTQDCLTQKSVTCYTYLPLRCPYSVRHGAEGRCCAVLQQSGQTIELKTVSPSHRRWLLGLLVLQSTSSFVLEQYQELLKQHLVVTVFLTMLVGAGGNAGNQSAIKVIRGLVGMH